MAPSKSNLAWATLTGVYQCRVESGFAAVTPDVWADRVLSNADIARCPSCHGAQCADCDYEGWIKRGNGEAL